MGYESKNKIKSGFKVWGLENMWDVWCPGSVEMVRKATLQTSGRSFWSTFFLGCLLRIHIYGHIEWIFHVWVWWKESPWLLLKVFTAEYLTWPAEHWLYQALPRIIPNYHTKQERRVLICCRHCVPWNAGFTAMVLQMATWPAASHHSGTLGPTQDMLNQTLRDKRHRITASTWFGPRD